MRSLRILASCSVYCKLVEESDVCNGDVGDNDDCGLMEVSDVYDDDVDDNDVQAGCSVHCRLVEEGDVCDGHTDINTCPMFWQVGVTPAPVAVQPHRYTHTQCFVTGVCHAIHCGNAATELSCMANLQEHVDMTSLPVLPHLLSLSNQWVCLSVCLSVCLPNCLSFWKFHLRP